MPPGEVLRIFLFLLLKCTLRRPLMRAAFSYVMKKPADNNKISIKLLTIGIVMSLLGHVMAGVLLDRFRSWNLGTAINDQAAVMVDLKNMAAITQPPHESLERKTKYIAPPSPHSPALPESDPSLSEQFGVPVPLQHPPEPLDQGSKQQQAQKPPEEFLLDSDSIVPLKQERLAYKITLLGIPVGSALLEASNKNGEMRITTSVRSNSVMSAVYPVNDSTDTRLVKGRYLLTRIRQQEGLMFSDTGFNMMFQERKIFWVDRLKMRSTMEPLEHLDTLDIISGFYFIRQQPLAIGKILCLRLYDGDKSSPVPVVTIRQEKLFLPGMRSAETLVIKPLLTENGFFKNNREVLIWLTDDKNRVPVRVEVTTPVGRVVAELVSSELV
ncbi:MAG: hypothetical protein A2079_03390 [Geobacteraceae bacterium GWC2_48_7]|nr:MAG: hypothetical protein A2079_03390 [Geobacteraceae bacterium GWC2_48_7]